MAKKLRRKSKPEEKHGRRMSSEKSSRLCFAKTTVTERYELINRGRHHHLDVPVVERVKIRVLLLA